MNARYEVFEGEGGGFFWRLVAANGETLAHSESYSREADAWEGVDAARRAALAAGMLDGRGKPASPPAHLRPLGAKVPPDDRHVRSYPLRAVAAELLPPPEFVDARLRRGYSLVLPRWHWTHDQGYEGSCVGHAVALERAITNSMQRLAARLRVRRAERYDPIWIWRLAKGVDEWEDTRPEDDNGTSARAAYDICRDVGPRRVRGMELDSAGRPQPVDPGEPEPGEGVVEVNRWATTVDEIRAAVASGRPVCIGTPWMTGFDTPAARPGRFGRKLHFLPDPSGVGRLRGYHETCIYGADDSLQAFLLKNSWGRSYPLALLPYATMEWCFTDWADAAVVVDR